MRSIEPGIHLTTPSIAPGTPGSSLRDAPGRWPGVGWRKLCMLTARNLRGKNRGGKVRTIRTCRTIRRVAPRLSPPFPRAPAFLSVQSAFANLGKCAPHSLPSSRSRRSRNPGSTAPPALKDGPRVLAFGEPRGDGNIFWARPFPPARIIRPAGASFASRGQHIRRTRATNRTCQRAPLFSGLKRKSRRGGVPRRGLQCIEPNDSNVKEILG
jgi:hypothetical protein